MSTAFKLLGANHKIVVEAFDDPKVKGVSCFVSRAKTGGGVVTLTRRVSKLACRSLIKRHVPRISKLRTLRADGSEW